MSLTKRQQTGIILRFQTILKLFCISTIIVFFTCGCTRYVDKPVVVYIAPPETLLQAVDIPAFNGKYNRDLVEYIIQIKTALLQANARLQGIQAWIKESIK